MRKFMTIQIPDPGTGIAADKTGDNSWLAMTKVAENFSNQTHAASRLVGTAAGNVMQVGAFGLGSTTQTTVGGRDTINRTKLPDHSMTVFRMPSDDSIRGSSGLAVNTTGATGFLLNNYGANNALVYTHLSNMGFDGDGKVTNVATVGDVLIKGINATQDPNGFLKGASPIAEIYSDKMDLNQDATQQGDITFEKLGVGDYLVKGSLGFAQEGWHIETPKDANGNVLVAVIEKQLANNDLSIKTYAKKFDDETGDIVPNLLKTSRHTNWALYQLTSA